MDVRFPDGNAHVVFLRCSCNKTIMLVPSKPETPTAAVRPRFSDLRWLVPFSFRAFRELVRAKWALRNLGPKEILAFNFNAKSQSANRGSSCTAEIERIGYVIPRLSHRLPWRSDCLIQAIAGQNWLFSLGITSEIRIGVELPKDKGFGAHAWLICDEVVVTGGEIDRYELLLHGSK